MERAKKGKKIAMVVASKCPTKPQDSYAAFFSAEASICLILLLLIKHAKRQRFRIQDEEFLLHDRKLRTITITVVPCMLPSGWRMSFSS